ncbi:pseudouridine synthase [Phenylobacterium sp.]|uniref:pseudouridine synthase n=1 Tax=Phenylobacterium sp. TaxID=1871053 RepID=UPI00286BBADF|nr:pseudouridine synthase [Phenylobacterium sp.]
MIHDPQDNDETAPGQGERVAKALARAGVASRRDVEKLIEAGRVALNGEVLTTPAVKVEAGDVLTVDGKVVNEAEPTRLFRYHKPVDLLTTHKDPQGRPTVFDHLPAGLPRLISVGRLDINSEGLLLLTNDGELARALESPANGVVRRYRVRARGRITQPELDKLAEGVTVEGVTYGPIEAKIDKAKEGPQGANIWITVTLAEGKNREVRRVMQSIGLTVGRLIRLSYGPFALGTLEMGQVEEVGPRVIREQLSEYIAPANLPEGDRPLFVDKAGRSSGGRRTPAGGTGAPEPKKKAVYKSGWATPKIEVKVHAGQRKRAPRPDVEASSATPAKPHGEVPLAPRARSSRLVADKPGGIRTFSPGAPLAPSAPPPRSSGPRPAGRPKSKGSTLIDRRPYSADGPRPTRDFKNGPKREGASSDRPRSYASDKPRPAGPKREGGPRGPDRPPRGEGPKRAYASDGPRPPRSDAPRPEYRAGPKREGGPGTDRPRPPRSDAPPRGPRPDYKAGPKREGGPSADRPRAPRADGPPRGPRPDYKPGPRREDGGKSFDGPRPPRSDAPRVEGKPSPYRGRNADSPRPPPKGPGSPRADARPAGPRAPSRSSAPPRSSGARPPGPPKGGGPKRRG